MKYTSTQSRETNDGGRRLLIFTAAMSVLLIAGFFAIQPPRYIDISCDSEHEFACGCPSNSDDIRNRNVILIDTTDPLRKGRTDDIQRLIGSLGSTAPSLIDWLRDRKRSDMTSVFILNDVPIADMRPIAKFCTPPPEIAQVIGFKGREISALTAKASTRLTSAVRDIQFSSTANQSPIVDALATVVKSPVNWTPGSSLVLVSDLIENTATCGWFERLSVIPAPSQTSIGCQQLIREFQEGLRPNAAHPQFSTVAICTLPTKQTKAGLHRFWGEIVKGVDGYDVLYSCDPDLIRARNAFLRDRKS